MSRQAEKQLNLLNQIQRQGKTCVRPDNVGTEDEPLDVAENQTQSTRLHLILSIRVPQTERPSADGDGDGCGSAPAETRLCEHAAAVAVLAHVPTASQGQRPARSGSHRQAPMGPSRECFSSWTSPLAGGYHRSTSGSAPHHFANALLINLSNYQETTPGTGKIIAPPSFN